MLGLIEYLVQSNDSADCVSEEDRFKYIDDLTILELVALTDALIELDCHQSVPSNIATCHLSASPHKTIWMKLQPDAD